MNTDEVIRSIVRFLREHSTTLYHLSTNEAKSLELAATTAVTEHYKSNGYAIQIVNPNKRPQVFVVKTSTRGYPWNFSRVAIEKNGSRFEIHMNLMVRSAHDEGIYCVDVAIAKEGSVPRTRTAQPWLCISNADLITFAEVKKLVIYPMLVAQFIGIVNEIKPNFLGGRKPRNFNQLQHLPPTLISLGYFSGNTQRIISNFSRRKFFLMVAENFDVRLARLRGKQVRTAFYEDYEI